MESSWKSGDFLLTENIKKENQGLIVQFYKLIQIL